MKKVCTRNEKQVCIFQGIKCHLVISIYFVIVILFQKVGNKPSFDVKRRYKNKERVFFFTNHNFHNSIYSN
jgi:hypothetical protein